MAGGLIDSGYYSRDPRNLTDHRRKVEWATPSPGRKIPGDSEDSFWRACGEGLVNRRLPRECEALVIAVCTQGGEPSVLPIVALRVTESRLRHGLVRRLCIPCRGVVGPLSIPARCEIGLEARLFLTQATSRSAALLSLRLASVSPTALRHAHGYPGGLEGFMNGATCTQQHTKK
jgi:hypothetical protein